MVNISRIDEVEESVLWQTRNRPGLAIGLPTVDIVTKFLSIVNLMADGAGMHISSEKSHLFRHDNFTIFTLNLDITFFSDNSKKGILTNIFSIERYQKLLL